MSIELIKYRIHFRVLWAVWLTGVISGCLATGDEISSLNSVLPFMGHDKLLHYGAYVGLACLSILAFQRGRGIVVALSVIPLGGAIELAQRFSPGRTPDIVDAIFNSLGVFSGMLIGLLISKACTRSQDAAPSSRSETGERISFQPAEPD
jgi:VanZ like family